MLLRCIYLLLWVCLPLCSGAQYIALPLCSARATLNDAIPRCVVQLNIPPNTVRVLYTLNVAEGILPDTVGLLAQATALLPDKLGWMGIARIPDNITGVQTGPAAQLYFYDNKRCVDRFARKNTRQCKARLQVDSCTGGSFDIPWQATLFPEKYYLCIVKPIAQQLLHFSVEVVAIVAE